MDQIRVKKALIEKHLETFFPPEKSDDFFDAFYGGSEDSHFDIRLSFDGFQNSKLIFSFHLIQRQGKCLACNMTYGLPHVFARHPIINISGLVKDIASLLGIESSGLKWSLGNTATLSSELHKIPLIISIQ